MADDVFDVVLTATELDALDPASTPSDIWRELYGHDPSSLPANLAVRVRDLEDAAGPGGGGLYDAYVCARHEEAGGTNGGTLTAGAWRTRPLNVEADDTAGIASLASNLITLPAGSYRVEATGLVTNVGLFKSRIHDVTNDVVLVDGINGTHSGALSNQAGFVSGRFTLAAPAEIAFQNLSTGTQADSGFGATTFLGGTEVYASVEIWRES